MGILVYSLQWVMQDFVHQQYELSYRNPTKQCKIRRIHNIIAEYGMVKLKIYCIYYIHTYR